MDPENLALSAGTGLPGDLKIKSTVSLGCVFVIEALWEKLGTKRTFSEIARRKGLKAPYERALLAMTVYATRKTKGNNLRKFGRAKEGTWGPQVVVALAVTREGIPVRCWVFPGNTTNVDTVEQVRKDLRGWNPGRALFVADASMNSQRTIEKSSQGLAASICSPVVCQAHLRSSRPQNTMADGSLRQMAIPSIWKMLPAAIRGLWLLNVVFVR
jgi:hypothetical protein